MKFIKKVAKFVKDCAIAAKNKVVGFFKGVYHNAYATTILVLATLGVNAMIGQLPFMFALPLWVEATMVIPLISVFVVWLLVKAMEVTNERREAKIHLVAA
jgi:uncharacterized membrane protein YhdT